MIYLFSFLLKKTEVLYDCISDFVTSEDSTVLCQIVDMGQYENGNLYQYTFRSQNIEFRNRLRYFYVEQDKIYKIESSEENIASITEKKELPNDKQLVCQANDLKDSLDEDEKGWHFSILAKEEKKRISCLQ